MKNRNSHLHKHKSPCGFLSTGDLLVSNFKNGGGEIVYTVWDLFDDSLRSKNKFTTQT